ncbi:uncharacterized protein LAESUDRAFT_744420 [Laetiporus sulphureus 93-53]|uniref:Citrate transporter-like domain-containing protein n=1 Tax=Laetiporus sulphureus 93-53 TaxID=1314785 RepID=A0A165D122_9APHY|nr:uncharacterized protein LAESUDRAFT_744420 [Laetiporus sulphureus 93-53]KZT03924.1 hypothetical protein LAESUDRAFT_744420 [Laetiporus sulphureus 93-53]
MSNTNIGHWSAVLVLVFFFISSEDKRRHYLHLNFITVPFFSFLVLLAAGAIDGKVVHDGIVGANGVKPLDIMALFISLAYLSISLDATGLLRFLAFWVVQKGGSSGRRLFTALYVFFLLCGVIVGNDPVILSGTAFLAYLTRVSGITNPTAWIFSQFAAANMASVVLVSSNPTNLVLSGAFSLSFTTYTAHCILPFLGAAVVVYPVLILGLFRSAELIPSSIDLNITETEDIRETLIDRTGAIFGSILLLITLGVLVGTSTIGISVWEVTVPPAIIMLLRDTYHDWSRRPHPSQDGYRASISSGLQEDLNHAVQPNRMSNKPQIELQGLPARLSSRPSLETLSQAEPEALLPLAERYWARFSFTFPTVTAIAKRLPFPLLPFAFLMFILVQGLSSQGWVELFARWWAAWVHRTGLLGAIGGMGFLACMFCNVCGTNIGATILLARVIQLWASNDGPVDVRTKEGAIYALALGSNYGAFTLTFSASLAGLLWHRILQQKGIHVRPRQFLMLNLPISIIAMTCSAAILLAQIYVIHGQ